MRIHMNSCEYLSVALNRGSAQSTSIVETPSGGLGVTFLIPNVGTDGTCPAFPQRCATGHFFISTAESALAGIAALVLQEQPRDFIVLIFVSSTFTGLRVFVPSEAQNNLQVRLRIQDPFEQLCRVGTNAACPVHHS